MRAVTARTAGVALLLAAAMALGVLGLMAPVALAEPTTHELTEADDGREVRVQTGDVVRLTLVPPAGSRWTAPTSHASTGHGMFRYRLGLDADRTVAVFSASSVSRNVVASELDLRCRHVDPVCAPSSRAFSVTVVVDPAPSPTVTPAPTAYACPSPSPSAAVGGPVDDAVELTPEDESTAVSVEVGQRVSIRMREVGQVVRVSPATGLFVDRWYVDPEESYCGFWSPRTHLVLEAVAPAQSTVDVVDDRECFYTYGCGLPIRRWRFGVGIGAAGSTASAASIAVDRATVTAGNSPTITTRLTTASGSPAQGYVTLFAKAYGAAAYTEVGTQYAAEGSASFVVRPSVQTAYVAAVRNVRGRVTSPAQLVRVHARVVVDHPVANGGVDGPTAVFTGSLVPARPRVRVGVAVQTSRGLRYLGEGVTGADGRFLFRAGGLSHGWHVFVVYTSARAGTLRGSTRIRVHVGCC